MDKLYYDDNDRILWIQKEDGTEYPIYTLANLNGLNTRLTDDGLLEVFNGFTNTWEIIRDDAGYPVSLKGPQGIPGRDGKDGLDGKDSVSYRLDLSNDMDLVFVASSENTTVEYELIISTGCSIYANDALESTDGWDISVVTPSTWPSGATYTVTDNAEILFSFPIGTIVPLILYSCTIVASSEKSTIRKDFKIKRVSGSVDYDLYIPYSYFKLYTNGSVSPTELPIKIKQKTLGSPSSELSIITPLELPQGYSIKYQWAGGPLLTLSATDKIVPKTNIVDNDLLTVSLYCDGEEIDQATLEVISSGLDGKSTQAIELTNDLDLLFIEATGIAVAGQTFTIGVSLFEGTTLQDINAQNVFVDNPDSSLFAVTVLNSLEDSKNVNISITPIGLSFNGSSTYKFPITVGSALKIFTLILLLGSIDYDLVLDPAFIKAIKSDDGTFKEYLPGSLLVQVSQKEVGKGESTRTYVDTLPDGYSIAWKIDQDYLTAPLVLNTPYSLPIPTNAESIPNKITVELHYTYFDELLGKNSVLVIDRAETAIYADGQKGAPGESSFYLDFTNDYDQIYKVDGVLLPNQYYTSDVYVFKGSHKVQLNDVMSLALAEDPTFGNVTITPDYENHCFNVRIDFTESEGSNLPQDAKQLSFKFKLSYLSEEGTSVDIFHTAKIAVLNSAHNYDLYANRYQIAKDGSGNLKDATALKFEIRHTDLSLDGNSFNTLTTLSELLAAGLLLKYVIDNGEDYTTVVTSDMSIGTDILRSVLNNLWIELWEGDTLRDLEQIRVVKDGADATVYYIDLSNDMDLVYLTHDRAVIETITVESGIKVYKGTEDVTTLASISITREHDAIYEERLLLIDGSLEIEYKKDTVIQTGIQVLNYCVTASLDGLEVTKRFKVYVFVGDVSYDLRPSTSVIRKDKSGNYTPSNIRIYVDKTELANTTSAHRGINWSEENITVYYTVNENPLTSLDLIPTDSAAGETFATISLTPDMFGSSTNPSLLIYLNGQDNRTIDYVQIEILHDGKDGLDGKDGKDGVNASGYTIDFSNDSDQIYIDSNSFVYPDQVITTTITGLKGTVPLTVGTDFLITGIAVDGSPAFVDTNAIYEPDPINNCYNVSFTAIAGAQVPAGTQTVSYTISAVFEGTISLTKRYKITIIKGSTDYDLNVDTTRLRLDKDKVVSPANVTATVRKREIVSNQSDPVELSPSDPLWASENLAIKYAYSANSNVQDQVKRAIDHASWSSYTNGITTSSYQQIENCLVVALFSTASSKCLDYTIIDILSDGEQGPPGIKGDDSIVLQSKSGNSHVFYLSPDGHILQEDLTKVFEFELVEGGLVRSFTGTLSCSATGSRGGIGTSVGGTTVTFIAARSKEGGLKSYIPGTYTFTVSDGVRSVTITITLAIGTTVYDLAATPMCVHYNPSNNTYDEIVFSVYTECSGGGYFEELEITTGFELKYSTESNSNSQSLGTRKSYQVDSNTSITRYYYTPTAEEAITVNCYTTDGALQDFVILPVVRDGAPGTLEANVLSIKDANGNEVGGMSGVQTITINNEDGTTTEKSDNILLWGGGDHLSAINGRSTIAITKDGTNSRIGPFVVGKNTATIKGSLYIEDLGVPFVKLDARTAGIASGYSAAVGDTVGDLVYINMSPRANVRELMQTVADTTVSASVQIITDGLNATKSIIYELAPRVIIDLRTWTIPRHKWTITFDNLPNSYFKNGLTFDSMSILAVTNNGVYNLSTVNYVSISNGTPLGIDVIEQELPKGTTYVSLLLYTASATRWNSVGAKYRSDLNDNVFKGCTLTIKPSVSKITYTTPDTSPKIYNNLTTIGNDGLVINNGSAAIGIYLDPGKGLVISLKNVCSASKAAVGELYVENGYLKIKSDV